MQPDDGPLRPRSTESAKSVLLTILGEFVLPSGGSTWTGTMIEALEGLGYGSRNARQVLTRLRDDGLITSERRGRRTRWHLAPDGRELLEAGARRIYRFGHRAESWDGRWLLIHCSVPEAMRRERRRLQTRLSFEGFGFLSPTVAVSPYCELEETANRVLAELGLTDLAVVLAGRTGSLAPDEVILERAWDLENLAATYRELVERFDDRQPEEPRHRFEELVRLVHHWRRFPFLDPEIPHQLLPVDWVGLQAQELFEDRRARWGPDAATWYKELEAANDR